MATNIGNSSANDEPELMMEINTTPLIDVMLVLLVMLIITIPIQLHAVNLEMPVGAPPTNQAKPEKIQIYIEVSSVGKCHGLPDKAQERDGKSQAVSQQSSQTAWNSPYKKGARNAVSDHVRSSTARGGLPRVRASPVVRRPAQ